MKSPAQQQRKFLSQKNMCLNKYFVYGWLDFDCHQVLTKITIYCNKTLRGYYDLYEFIADETNLRKDQQKDNQKLLSSFLEHLEYNPEMD